VPPSPDEYVHIELMQLAGGIKVEHPKQIDHKTETESIGESHHINLINWTLGEFTAKQYKV